MSQAELRGAEVFGTRRDNTGNERKMTAIDFAAFVDKLATVSGETILPFFRTALAVEAKHRDDGAFDPVTAADRGAEMVIFLCVQRMAA